MPGKGQGLFALPLKAAHIHTAVCLEFNSLLFEQGTLQGEARRRSARVVDDAVAGIIAVPFGMAEHLAHKAGIFTAADQAGNLPV